MDNYRMLYEQIVLAAWGKTWRHTDPLGLGDTDTMGILGDDLDGDHGNNAKLGLAAAIRKVVIDQDNNPDTCESLTRIYQSVLSAKEYNDLCRALEATRIIFNSIGFNIL